LYRLGCEGVVLTLQSDSLDPGWVNLFLMQHPSRMKIASSLCCSAGMRTFVKYYAHLFCVIGLTPGVRTEAISAAKVRLFITQVEWHYL
jgi:hypothetical protein